MDWSRVVIVIKMRIADQVSPLYVNLVRLLQTHTKALRHTVEMACGIKKVQSGMISEY